MKLSEAIRLGSLLKPQGFGDLLDHKGRSCAFGAALEASGYRISADRYADNPSVHSVWSWLKNDCRCPEQSLQGCSEIYIKNMATVIAHLNDHHLWTREQISAWVETVEPGEVAQTEEVLEEAQNAIV